MSMISELIKNLRWYGSYADGTEKDLMYKAADTIESLSAKLAAANMERSEDCDSGWIPCWDRLPEGMEDVLVFYKASIDGGTHDGEEIHNFGIGCYFSHSNKWSIVTLVKTKNNTQKVISWQPLPEPYRP